MAKLGEGERAKLGEGKGTKLGEGKGAKLGEGEGARLGEGCPKVRLSQDRMPILSPSPSLLRGERD
jgi:hypothetical protein